MADNIAWLLCRWTGSGTESDPYRPAVPYNVKSTVDIVGIASEQLIATPNSTTVEVLISDEELAKVPAAEVLMSKPIVEEVPVG
jgi:hypothetical protein